MSLQEKYNQLLGRCMESLQVYQTIIEENLHGNEKNVEINSLQELAKGYCNTDFNFNKRHSALEKLEGELENIDLDTEVNVSDMYKGLLAQDTSEEDYMSNDIWDTLFKGNSSVIEVVKKKKVIDESQFVAVNDSISCSNVFKPPVDPLTKAVIRDPYKNTKCGHIYDHQTILDYINSKRKATKCPYIGCSNQNVVPNQLTADAELKVQIMQYLREHENDSDTESD